METILVVDDEPTVLNLCRRIDRKSTRLNSSHSQISYAVFCLITTRHNSVQPGSATNSHAHSMPTPPTIHSINVVTAPSSRSGIEASCAIDRLDAPGCPRGTRA